jgi:hypothetical protein
MRWGGTSPKTCSRIFGSREPQFAAMLDEAARSVIELIANSDGLYHDGQHRALVTLCLQDILRGRRVTRIARRRTGVHGSSPR